VWLCGERADADDAWALATATEDGRRRAAAAVAKNAAAAAVDVAQSSHFVEEGLHSDASGEGGANGGGGGGGGYGRWDTAIAESPAAGVRLLHRGATTVRLVAKESTAADDRRVDAAPSRRRLASVAGAAVAW
jgi:hypothetical protein